jgi:hypothetical protein
MSQYVLSSEGAMFHPRTRSFPRSFDSLQSSRWSVACNAIISLWHWQMGLRMSWGCRKAISIQLSWYSRLR